MSQYLLAAEADQIQDLLFRSSQLRKVVGGSQLLTRFCVEGAQELLEKHGGNPTEDIIIADGGNFRILFPNEQKAKEFGNDLAELYRLVLGSSLTIADPVGCDLSRFQDANHAARNNLRSAKRVRKGAVANVHLPYMAFCESCGVQFATGRHQQEGRNQANYICKSCSNKLDERERKPSEFLDAFRKAVGKVAGLRTSSLRLPIEAEEVARFDSRRYVAYLIADGNGMGVWFGNCQAPDQMRSLSKALSLSLRFALAEPCGELLKQEKVQRYPNSLPVLPLILGGDDCFALMPAPWAIDFARRFCLAYEEAMTPEIQEVGEDKATIAAAVVICKANYPYYHARERGEALLKNAKRLVKSLNVRFNINLSAVSFDVITGNESIQPTETETSERYQPTLCPYLVSQDPLPENALKSGILINTLLDQRHKLSPIPSRRIAELRSLYTPDRLSEIDNDPEDWNNRLNILQSRIGRNPKDLLLLQNALNALGASDDSTKPGYWLKLVRPALNGSSNGHGMPDLISAWDYTFDLKKELTKDYEEER